MWKKCVIFLIVAWLVLPSVAFAAPPIPLIFRGDWCSFRNSIGDNKIYYANHCPDGATTLEGGNLKIDKSSVIFEGEDGSSTCTLIEGYVVKPQLVVGKFLCLQQPADSKEVFRRVATYAIAVVETVRAHVTLKIEDMSEFHK
jgi:hypothetical protein